MLSLASMGIPGVRLVVISVLVLGIAGKPPKSNEQAPPGIRPVVLMHGLLATAEAMSHAQKWIQNDFPGIHILNVEVGNGSKTESLFMNINKQVDQLAAAIRADPKLVHGFNLIGHSQGGLLARAYIHRYNDPPVYNYISWAGPHDGVYGVPDLNALCPNKECPWLNQLMDDLMNSGVPSVLAQEAFTFAAYWKSPFNYSSYLKSNIFLADINNERLIKNKQYRANFVSLNKVALVRSLTDFIVVPRTSEWFQFWTEGNATTVVPFRLTQAYIEDWIGLRTLDESGKLVLKTVTCGHQDVPRDKCKTQVYDNFTRDLLNNTLPESIMV